MATQTRSASSFFNDNRGIQGRAAWQNMSNAAASNDTYATATVSSNWSDYLRSTNFGFDIPSDALILGIELRVEAKVNQNAANSQLEGVQAVLSGSTTGNSMGSVSPLTTSDSYYTVGGPANLWGRSWTPAEINDSTFGVMFSSGSFWFSGTTSVDHVEITVHYETGTPPGTETSETREVRATGSLPTEVSREVRLEADEQTQALVRFAEIESPFALPVSSVSRNVRLTGQAPTQSERTTRVTGKDSANVDRQTRLTGQAEATVNRDVRLGGTADTSVERAIRLIVQDTTSHSVETTLVGEASAQVEREARTFGILETSIARDVRLVGIAKTTEVVRGVRLFGHGLVSVDLDVGLVSQDSTQVERSVRLSGQLSTDVERDVLTSGQAVATTSHNVRVTAQATTTVARAVKLIGGIPTYFTRDVRVVGEAASQVNRNVRVRGQAFTDIERDIRTTGQAGTSEARNARVIGEAEATVTRAVRLLGGAEVAVVRAVRLTGKPDESEKIPVQEFDGRNKVSLEKQRMEVVDSRNRLILTKHPKPE
jgi:hypothetical protein